MLVPARCKSAREYEVVLVKTSLTDSDFHPFTKNRIIQSNKRKERLMPFCRPTPAALRKNFSISSEVFCV